MDDFHLFEDGGAIISDEYVTLAVLDLLDVRKEYLCTILSMPLGPKLVLTTSDKPK
jgi:hypothetical protein